MDDRRPDTGASQATGLSSPTEPCSTVSALTGFDPSRGLLLTVRSIARHIRDHQGDQHLASIIEHVCDKLGEREAEIASLLRPTAAAIAAALPLTNEPDADDWRLGDEACELLGCVNTDGELAAAQLSRDYKNVVKFLHASGMEAREGGDGETRLHAKHDSPTAAPSGGDAQEQSS